VPARPLRAGERRALWLRDQLGISHTAPIADIVGAIEAAGVPVFLTPLPHGISGLANRLNGRWYVVADTTTSSAGRLRFTLAHELGHVAMDHEPSIDDPSTLRMRDAGDQQEVEANYFAAEFLIPRTAVLDRLTGAGDLDGTDEQAEFVTRVANDYGTTAWIPLYRLGTLDILDKFELAAVDEHLKSTVRSEALLDDVAGRFAGSSQTRQPTAHEARLRELEELNADDGNDDPAA
jgi:Zn-dependent peptidase ImmA (M78 family)